MYVESLSLTAKQRTRKEYIVNLVNGDIKIEIMADSLLRSCICLQSLSRPCAFEVLRVMRQRSISVDLEPRIEMPCISDLGYFCSQNIKRGEVRNAAQPLYLCLLI